MGGEIMGWKAAAHVCEEWAKDFDAGPTLMPGFNAENAAYWRAMGKVVRRREWTAADIRFAGRALATAKAQAESGIAALIGAPEIPAEARNLHAFLSEKMGAE